MTRVIARTCANYENAYSALAEIWERLNADSLVRGKRVLLKVNLTKGAPPERAVVTHPQFTRAVVRLVRDAGGEPVIGDASCVYGLMRQTLALTGYRELVDDLDVEFHPLDSGRVRRVVIDGLRVKETYVSEHVDSADVIISLPKLKTHDLMVFTGAVKNMFGIVPGAIKPYLHYRHAQHESFIDALLDIFAYRRPDIALMDGIVGMEGQGPTLGDPRHLGVVGGSTDAVALDRVMAQLAMLPPVPMLARAWERGLGSADLSQIRIDGPPIESMQVRIKPARITAHKIGFLGKFKYLVRAYSVKPDFRHVRMDELDRLQDACPVGAIKINGGVTVSRACVRCMTCVESSSSVSIKVPRVLHGAYRARLPGYHLDHIA